MNLDTMVQEIRTDMGSDVVSLAIKEDTIKLKIEEAVRKISSYAPYIRVETYPLSGGKVVLDETTVMVSQVLSDDISKSASSSNSPIYDETDLFNASRYMYNYTGTFSDPYIYMMKITELRTLQNMVALKDWHYDKKTHTVFLNSYNGSKVTIKSLQKYNTLEDITDPDIIQAVKEYSVALCKIVEGTIRRKLQNAPGAIQLDGDSLVSEGMSERERLDEKIRKDFSYLRFGIKA